MLTTLEGALVRARQLDLRTQACRDALARLARCCRPGAAARALGWLRAGQLGRGYLPPCCES